MYLQHPHALEDEDVRFRLYLEEQGYDTSEMGVKTDRINS